MSFALHDTPMGRKFFEHDFPELIRQFDRLNHNVEELIKVLCER